MQGQLVSGRYRLADAIGSGGMGRVWRAHDEVLHRAVAIKELTAALYVSESDQERLLARTRAEARAAARINHSAVVTVHDVLEHDGRPWIVMELVEGHSLADAVKEQGRVEPAEAARIGLWVLRALRAAHSAGVLHRDVKPGNVLLSADDGRVLLTDFGIAQIEGDTTITRTGEVVGSVDYLAPERVRGHDPGPSSDLWALGATLYTAVEGRSPFRRTSPLGTMQAVVEEEAADPQYAGPLAPVITALLRKDPATRPDAAEAEQMLAEAAEGRRPHAAQVYVPTQHNRYEPEAHSGGYHSAGYPPEAHTGSPHAGTPSHAGMPPHAPTGPATPATSTPYPPMGRPTTIGRPYDTSGTGAPHGPSAHPPRKRRRLRTLALVIALAAIIGGGTAVVLQKWGLPGGGGTPASSSSTQGPTEGESVGPEGGVPSSWVQYKDPLGFSLYLPKGWEREVVGKEYEGLQQVDYTPDGGEHFVRIAVDTSPDFAKAYDHMADLEQQVSRRLVGYQRVSLKENLYRDRDGALWDYTWTAQPKDTPFPGPRRAIDQAYIDRDGTEYAIYISSPVKDWEPTRKQFSAVLKGWQASSS
ncbi:serine/threonine-protein kinase [Streptomyces lanatus]|uniref:non-specific serine/threonine protein kinase n=1 Tax=Streptomyces lanatus TaxID=66900 RepID=A0ABV1XUS6_9ACTN|nr:serine/threonine-protein kinase [Streptomyces lanatus]